MPKGLASSRWASDLPHVTSWPRPPPPAFSHSSSSSTITTTYNRAGQPTYSSSYPGLGPGHLANTSSPSLSGPAAQNDPPSSPEQQLSRFLKIVARLKWKIPFLEIGYTTALDRVGRPQQEIDANEIHFKLDFHEFYMLIERALVHLMGVYGIVIHARSDPGGGGNGNGNGNGDGNGNQRWLHQYHENVLLALDNPANPLHETLGAPGVRGQFARAKELRNRWKHADADASVDGRRFVPAPLEAYNLKEILQTILLALERAYFVTEQFMHQRSANAAAAAAAAAAGPGQPLSTADWTTNSDDWGFMVDAMDWEVV